MSISDLAYAGLEEALNQYIALDPAAPERLAQLHGRVIGMEFVGLNLRIYLIPGPGRLQLLSQYEGEPDCLLRGSPTALASLGAGSEGERSAEELFAGRVEISGDTELGHRFGEILGSLNIDWEKHLSRFTGDFIAHEIGNGARTVKRWGQQLRDGFYQDIREYLQEQGRLLPSRQDIQVFLDSVDALRDDTERLEARVKQLLQSSARSPEGTPGA